MSTNEFADGDTGLAIRTKLGNLARAEDTGEGHVYTSANLLDISHAVNTTGKYEGKMVFDTTLHKPLWADGVFGSSTWRDATNAGIHTPS